MKKILVGLLAVGSISSFASSKLAICKGDYLKMTVDQKGLVELIQNGVKTIHTAIIGSDEEGYPHVTIYELKLEKIKISDEDATHVLINNTKARCRADI